MPRLPDGLEHAIAFLYPTYEAAEKNERVGGTCFIVGRPIEGVIHPRGGTIAYSLFAVSNRHVVWNAGSPVMRLNRRDGTTEIIDLIDTEWTVHPDGDDLAAVYLGDRLDRSMHHLRLIEEEVFITEAKAKEHALGLGDHVFMMGRFVNYQGTKDQIAPAVRFGNISMMPTPLWNGAVQKHQIGYAVEMRSRTGFSGSPVSVYRSKFDNPFRVPTDKPVFWGLLGVNWGYVLDGPGGENTWLNGVIPAWKITELLEVPELRKKHDDTIAAYKTGEVDDAGAVPAGVTTSERSDEEIAQLRDEGLRRALNTPPKPKRKR